MAVFRRLGDFEKRKRHGIFTKFHKLEIIVLSIKKDGFVY